MQQPATLPTQHFTQGPLSSECIVLSSQGSVRACCCRRDEAYQCITDSVPKGEELDTEEKEAADVVASAMAYFMASVMQGVAALLVCL